MAEWKKVDDFCNEHEHEIELRQHEPMAKHTWYRIGGAARRFIYPKTIEAMIGLIETCCRAGISWIVLGHGANVLVSDEGFDGVVISPVRYLDNIERLDGTCIKAQSGVSLPRLVRYCEENALSGMVALSGIPGSVGGACCMNAGTDQGTLGDRIKTITTYDPLTASTKLLDASAISFGYRNVPKLQGRVVIGCTLSLDIGDKEILYEQRQSILQKRRRTQPVEDPSCGSVFKRPSDDFAGRLIEAAGMKGRRRGGAQVSSLHAGFIVNTGSATAADVVALIHEVRTTVEQYSGVRLEPEVRFVGFSSFCDGIPVKKAF